MHFNVSQIYISYWSNFLFVSPLLVHCFVVDSSGWLDTHIYLWVLSIIYREKCFAHALSRFVSSKSALAPSSEMNPHPIKVHSTTALLDRAT